MDEVALRATLDSVDWTFRGVKAKEGIHGIHSYPAMMPAVVARRLILELTEKGDMVFDPFCGSGTVLAEAAVLQRRAVGYDINPLALLVAKVKTTPLHPVKLRRALEAIESRVLFQTNSPVVPDFPNIGYWFKPEVIADLAQLREAIEAEDDKDIKDFFKLVFARTVRQVSNTRGNEFKLYRLSSDKLNSHKPNVFVSFGTIAMECIGIMEEFYSVSGCLEPIVDVKYHDARLPFDLPPNSVSLMLTSPPYGDSRTTVAYGQFSRLALQWLNMWTGDVDRESLGGRPAVLAFTRSATLREALSRIKAMDAKRGDEVEAFYQDLQQCIENISVVIKPGGFAVFVVANRRVKGVTLPTDEIVVEMMVPLGFAHLGTFHREIPNKRMPLRNSPSNVPGKTDVTMLSENIVVLRKG